jgi:hypothetical protein
MFLLNDSGTAWIGPGTLGTTATLQNTLCAIDLYGSTVSTVDESLTLAVPITFSTNPELRGRKAVSMNAFDNAGLDSGWVVNGFWDVF